MRIVRVGNLASTGPPAFPLPTLPPIPHLLFTPDTRPPHCPALVMLSPASSLPSPALAAEITKLASSGETRRYATGTIIFQAGAAGDGFYVVQSGHVQLTAPVGDNPPRVLATVGPGDFFGEMAVIDDAPRSANAVAGDDAVVVFLGRETLHQLIESRPKIALELLREFSRRIRALNQKYVEEILHAERLAAVGRFAGAIVHDFKNPLAIIGLSAELAGSPDAAPPQRARAEQTINRQIKRMTAMLEDLVDFTRPLGRKITLEATDFAEFMRELTAELTAETSPRQVLLLLPSDPPPVTVRIEPQHFARIFYNLVNTTVDALQGAPGSITIRFAREADQLRIEYEDSGPGIPAEYERTLFEPFAARGKAHGTGLRLSICRKIATDQGGRIWAECRPDRSTLFCITLPLGA